MKRILLMSDGYSLKTGYGGVARNIADYLHSTGKYEIAYLSWFFNHKHRQEFGAPKFIEFTTFKDHNGCCQRGNNIVEKYYSDNKMEYYKVENKIAMLPLPGDKQLCASDNIMQNDRYAYESLAPIIQHYKPDIVWTLGDTWMTYHAGLMPQRKSYKWINYHPIDSAPTPPVTIQGPQVIEWLKAAQSNDECVTFCQWGMDTLNKSSEKYGFGKLSSHFIWLVNQEHLLLLILNIYQLFVVWFLNGLYYNR